MTKKRYKEHAAKRETGGFVALPHTVLRSAEFAALSPRAVKLLCDLLAQYKGDNNGDLCAAMKLMKSRGWQGAATISRAVAELRRAEFIVTTRQGGKHKASLFAVTFYSIDWCGGKLEIKAPSRTHMGAWRRNPGVYPSPQVVQRKADCSTDGTIQPVTRTNSPPKEQPGRIPARPCSTRGHLSRDTTTTGAGQGEGKSEVAGGKPAGRPNVGDVSSTASAGGPISPQAEIQRARPAALELQAVLRVQYQEVLQRVREKAANAPRRARRLGKAHLEDPYWAFAVELLREGTGMDAKEAGAILGRRITPFGWSRVKRAVRECEDLMLWGFGAVKFVESYSFLLPDVGTAAAAGPSPHGAAAGSAGSPA